MILYAFTWVLTCYLTGEVDEASELSINGNASNSDTFLRKQE
jgi:hypothetical protein